MTVNILLKYDFTLVESAADADMVKIIEDDGRVIFAVRDNVKLQHMGPGDHPGGSSQDVHGKRTGPSIKTNAFPGHRGRPGQRGGSLPRSAGTGPTPKAVLDIYRKKTAGEPAITKQMQDLADETDSRLDGLNNRIKTEESFSRKVRNEAEEAGMSQEEYAELITDAVRYTMVYDDPGKFSESVKSVEGKLLEKGYQRYDHKRRNYFDPSFSDGTYQGYNTVWIAPTGETFELQFHTEQSLKIKHINHELYQIARTSKDQAERAALFQQMIDNWKSPEYTAPARFEILSTGD